MLSFILVKFYLLRIGMSLITLEEIYKSGTKLTPMMAQYYEIKKQHIDDIVFFRMGDFYEVFFEDAKDCSKILNIALTHRGKLGETPVPMAGIPHHAANNYIDKITEAGRRVAVCEQVENPKDAVGIVKRAVTQVVSPALPYDISKVSDADTFYICSAIKKGNRYFSTFLDYSTGDFFGEKHDSVNEFMDSCQKVSIKEIISYPGQFTENSEIEEFLERENILKSIISKEYFQERNSSQSISKFIPNYKHDQILKENPEMLDSIGAICSFVDITQKPEKVQHLSPFSFKRNNQNLYVSSKTLTGLEIIPHQSKSNAHSLFDFMKKTKTAMGTRELRSAFANAVTDKNAIELRQEFIELLVSEPGTLHALEESLEEIRDIDRLLTKISTKKYIPQDLINLSNSIEKFKKIEVTLKNIPSKFNELIYQNIPSKAKLKEVLEISNKILTTINSELSASLDKRNLILPGVNKNRDQLHELYANSAKKFEALEKKYLEETGIPKIKIKHNNIHGRFIEVSKLHSNKVPDYFHRRQTLVQSERYVTEELTKLEFEVNQAGERLREVEQEILQSFISEIENLSSEIKKVSSSIAQIDLFHCFAIVANLEQWAKPKINETTFMIKGAWHPLIKKATKGSFVPHDLKLDDEKYFGLITGPNMAGKTTVMREMAIIQLLAQMGSFVPASKATVTICDRIFSRLGASDNIQEGQSTFMVEMSETAEIIRHASNKSLIILDEIGRGTSTYDGLSIAWSLVEYLTKKLKAKTLFATHYHELIDLVDQLDGAKNLTVEAQSEGENVRFLYRLIEEGANQSYGIYVAKLAGIPKNILSRAKAKLNDLEKETKPSDQLNLWEQPQKINEEITIGLSHESNIISEEISSIDLNNMTPMQALEQIKNWQDRSNQISH